MKTIAAVFGFFMIGAGVFCTSFWSVSDLNQYENLYMLGGSIGTLVGGILLLVIVLMERNTSG